MTGVYDVWRIPKPGGEDRPKLIGTFFVSPLSNTSFELLKFVDDYVEKHNVEQGQIWTEIIVYPSNDVSQSADTHSDKGRDKHTSQSHVDS